MLPFSGLKGGSPPSKDKKTCKYCKNAYRGDYLQAHMNSKHSDEVRKDREEKIRRLHAAFNPSQHQQQSSPINQVCLLIAF